MYEYDQKDASSSTCVRLENGWICVPREKPAPILSTSQQIKGEKKERREVQRNSAVVALKNKAAENTRLAREGMEEEKGTGDGAKTAAAAN